jgi:tRNA (guanine-N7-)-methyltransferase
VRPRLCADALRLPAGDGLDPRALFGGPCARVELEIGPGRGWFMVERLEAEPSLRMVGLDNRLKWASIAADRLGRRGLGDRGRVFAEDARYALPRFAAASFSVVYVHFPDPWWKKRHHKRRLVTGRLMREVARVLCPGGELFIQTDVAERADAYQQTLGAVECLQPYEAQPRVPENPYGARSPRERRVLQDGLPVHRLRYRRPPA